MVNTMENKYAILFPGQGAQYVGMGKDFYENCDVARKIYDKADEILGFKLTELCFNGPAEELELTKNAQPAIFVTSYAILKSIADKYPDLAPSAVCGLSLGEFSALSVAGSIEFDTAVSLVRKRGLWMHESGTQNPGSMCSIIGLNVSGCEEVALQSGVQLANYNSPEQIVLSGSVDGIAKSIELANEKGAKKAIQLKVSGAFHSSLMSNAEEKMREELKSVKISSPSVRFVPNVTAEYADDPEEIRTYLAEQVTNSVRWFQTIEMLVEDGYRKCVEVGPGKVLKGLARRINSDLDVTNVDKVSDLDKVHNIISAEIPNA